MNSPNTEIITIVSGLPRSGTSMMMQFLQAGGMTVLNDETRLADVNNPHGYLEYEPVKGLAKNADWLEAAQGKVVKIIAQLLAHLPDHLQYRVLFMQRDLSEILDSQQRMLQQMGKPVAPQAMVEKIFRQQLQRVQQQFADSTNIQLLNVPHRDMYQQDSALFEQIRQFCATDLDLVNAASVIDAALYRSTC